MFLIKGQYAVQEPEMFAVYALVSHKSQRAI
ncbi:MULTISPECIES: hypothetical protein [Bacillus]